MIEHDTSLEPWIVKLVAPPAPRQRIVAFPSAGGTASSFRPWIRCLPERCELLAVQLPGRQKRTRETPLRQLNVVVSQMLPSIGALRPCRTTFVGDCMGAIIAYEMIRACAVRGLSLPERLVVSCCPAPHVQPRRRMMHALREEDLIADVKAHGLVPSWVLEDVTTLGSFLPLLRCDYQLTETYQHSVGAPIDVPILAFAASADTLTTREDVSQWECHTSRKFELIEAHGGHHLATMNPGALLHYLT